MYSLRNSVLSHASSVLKSNTKNVFTMKQMRMASTITDVFAREVIDSRGNPTVEVDLTTSDGMFRASVPSGASTGAYEAVELRDGGKRYMGKGVLKAVEHVKGPIKAALLGKDVTDQEGIDQIMIDADGTPNKGNFGANAILGVSLAVSKAGAGAKKIPLFEHYGQLSGNTDFILPVPSFNVINGGSHAGNRLAFQEFMILPVGAPTFTDAMIQGSEVYHNLSKVIKAKYGQDAVNVGDEGGFAPNIQSAEEGLDLLMAAIEKAGYLDSMKIGLDAASSEFWDKEKGKYNLDFKNPGGNNLLTGDEMVEMYKGLCAKYPIVSIEDPFDEDDWNTYSKLTSTIGGPIQIVGDDLLVTNPTKIAKGIELKSVNALLLKVNQIGSVSESIKAVKMSKSAGWGVMTSHRSGETEDNYIADLAVGLCTGQIKTGAPCRSERLSKYNQLLRIEESLGSKAIYAGSTFRTPAWMA